MTLTIYKTGYFSSLAAFLSTTAFVVAQSLQLFSILKFPIDEILIYSFSQAIPIPFLLEVLVLHYCVQPDKNIWSHAAILFSIIYLIFVTANYVVQLAVVLPETLAGNDSGVDHLAQTPHSIFWFFDATGYIAMGVAAFFIYLSLPKDGFQGITRLLWLLHSLTTPLIVIVYFYPHYSEKLLLLAIPWALTAPFAHLLLAMVFRRKYIIDKPGHRYMHKHLN